VIQVRLIPAIAVIILIWGSYPSLVRSAGTTPRPAATFLSRPTTALSLPVSAVTPSTPRTELPLLISPGTPSSPGTKLPLLSSAAPASSSSNGLCSRVLSYLALGDSYTIGESVDPADRYPVQAVGLLNGTDHLSCQDPDIIAVTGWTTGNLLDAVARLKPVAPYRMVSLLIGVNNQYQGRSKAECRDQFAELLQKSILLAGNDPSHVLVLSIPDYSVTPFGRTGDTSFIAADGLHFSGKEYGRWARLMEPWLKGMLQ
jgi:lysophospholipase L1-like esterase